MWSASAASSSSSSSQRGSSEGRCSSAPWRRRGLRLQAVPHCRLPTPDAFLNKYELGAQLGRGNFGTVWEARERATGHAWAAKVVAKSSNKLKMLLLSREIQVLKMVEHPNIVYLREIFETPENVYLILELCEHGELATFCREKGKISEDKARNMISGIANAIHYLHQHGIVHRDLKLENVLLAAPDPEGVSAGSSSGLPCAKLSDFGLAEVKNKRDHDHMMELFCGTPYCMAPEILSERAYSQQCDVWSMGVILYTLIAGGSPYLGGSERDVLYSIHRHPHLQDDTALAAASAGARDLLSRMLLLDPAYRITAAEVLVHPWITEECTQASASQDILTMMKEWRIEATDPEEAERGTESTNEARSENVSEKREATDEGCGQNSPGSGQLGCRGGRDGRGSEQGSCGSGQSRCGSGASGQSRKKSGCGTHRPADRVSVSDTDRVTRPASSSGAPRGQRSPLPTRPRTGPRPGRAVTGTPPQGTVGRRPATGGATRPDPAGTWDWVRPNKRRRENTERRTTRPS